MRLYLVRHPPPEIASGICYGSSDLAVSRDERERALCALAPRLPRGVPVLSSPLRRCGDLAGALAATLGSPPVIHDSRLAEMHFGDWEMRAWDDIARTEIDAWAADLSGYRPGGGESLLQFARRVQAVHEELKNRRRDTLVVCHAGTIRLLLACQRGGTAAGIALAAAQDRHHIAYGELIAVDCQLNNDGR